MNVITNLSELRLSYVYGGVINRMGTGEEPVTARLAALLPQPATFRTVTLRLPSPFTWLTKTCKNPMIVTLVGLTEKLAVVSSKIGRDMIELLTLTILPLKAALGLPVPAVIW